MAKNSLHEESLESVSGPRGQYAWLFALVVIALATMPATFVVMNSNAYGVDSYKTNTSDALIFRTAAELLREGLSPYDINLQLAHISRTRFSGATPPYHLPFAYPPNALPMLMLYLVGPPRVAMVLFVVISTGLMLWSVYLLASRFGWHSANRTLVILATAVGGAVVFNARLGQTGAFLAASVFFYVAFYGRAPIRAGIALGLMAFKPQYALPLIVVAIAGRRWRTVLTSGLTFALCTVTSGLLFGFDQWSHFYEAVRSYNLTMEFMCNWFAPVHRFMPDVASALHDAGLVVMLGGAVVIGLYCLLDNNPIGRSMRHLAAAIALAPVISPNTHPYDMIIWVAPICLIAHRSRRCPAWLAVGFMGFGVSALLATHLRWLLPIISVALAIAAVIPVDEPETPSEAV